MEVSRNYADQAVKQLGDFNADVTDLTSTLQRVTPLAVKLAKWRRAMPIKQVKEFLLANQKQGGGDRLLCAVLCSGGCLDTLAAIRAGDS